MADRGKRGQGKPLSDTSCRGAILILGARLEHSRNERSQQQASRDGRGQVAVNSRAWRVPAWSGGGGVKGEGAGRAVCMVYIKPGCYCSAVTASFKSTGSLNMGHLG